MAQVAVFALLMRGTVMGWRARIDLVKAQPLSDLAVKLGHERLDRGHVLCRNRNHQDSNPSLKFYPDTNSFYCWGCKWSGSTVDYVMGSMGLDLFAAVRLIERLFGLTVIRSESAPRTKSARALVDRLRARAGGSLVDSEDLGEVVRAVECALRARAESLRPEGEGFASVALRAELDRAYAVLDAMARDPETCAADLFEVREEYLEKLGKAAQNPYLQTVEL